MRNNNKKTKIQLEKRANDLNTHFPQKIYKGPISTRKDAPQHGTLGKCKSNLQ